MEIRRETLTVKEVALIIGISEKKVYDMCREKQIPHKRIGSRIVFRHNLIIDWLEQTAS